MTDEVDFGQPEPSQKHIYPKRRNIPIMLFVLAITTAVFAATSIFRLGYINNQTSPANLTVTIGNSPKQLVSSNQNSRPANGDSGRPTIDSSGRYVAFTSDATNLSSQATNGQYNIYRKDTVTGAIYLASGGLGGKDGNGSSQFPTICSTGRFIAFASTANNLTPDSVQSHAGQYFEVYVNDSLTGQTSLVSLSTSGKVANADSRAPQFSADCSSISFESRATNLVPGYHGKFSNVYVRNLLTGVTTIASIGNNGKFLNGDSTVSDINATATVVAFTSWASNLPQATSGHPAIYLHSLRTGDTVPVSAEFERGANVSGFSWPSFSPDGRYLIFRSLLNPTDVEEIGSGVYIWDVLKEQSTITNSQGIPTGLNNACPSPTGNGASLKIPVADPTAAFSYRVLLSVMQNGKCSFAFSDLQGKDNLIKSNVPVDLVLEVTMNNSGTYIGWDIGSQQQQVYACNVYECNS